MNFNNININFNPTFNNVDLANSQTVKNVVKSELNVLKTDLANIINGR